MPSLVISTSNSSPSLRRAWRLRFLGIVTRPSDLSVTTPRSHPFSRCRGQEHCQRASRVRRRQKEHPKHLGHRHQSRRGRASPGPAIDHVSRPRACSTALVVRDRHGPQQQRSAVHPPIVGAAGCPQPEPLAPAQAPGCGCNPGGECVTLRAVTTVSVMPWRCARARLKGLSRGHHANRPQPGNRRDHGAAHRRGHDDPQARHPLHRPPRAVVPLGAGLTDWRMEASRPLHGDA